MTQWSAGYVPLTWTRGEQIQVDLDARCVRRMNGPWRESLPFHPEQQDAVLQWAAWWTA